MFSRTATPVVGVLLFTAVVWATYQLWDVAVTRWFGWVAATSGWVTDKYQVHPIPGAGRPLHTSIIPRPPNAPRRGSRFGATASTIEAWRRPGAIGS